MIGERFNFEDVFFRDLTVCVLDTLEGEVRWVNKFSSGDRVVNVPFYYSMTGDERFLLDSFTDDVVSNSRYVDLNTDIIPRGHLTLTSYEIRGDEFANPNVWLKMVVENNDEIRKILTKVRAIPITAKYDLVIHLSSEIDTFKCSQAIMDTLWLYRFMYFEHNFLNIDAVMQIPDSNNIEINREKNLTSDNTIKLTVSFDVQTYYPAFRKPKLPDVVPYTVNSTNFINQTLSVRIDLIRPNADYLQETLAVLTIIFINKIPNSQPVSVVSDYPSQNTVIIEDFVFVTSTISEQVEELASKINNETDYTSQIFGTNIKVTAPIGSGSLMNNKILVFVGIGDEIQTTPFNGGSDYTESSAEVVFSESHLITTSSDGGMVIPIGAGGKIEGSYLNVNLKDSGLKINVLVDPNRGSDFIKIISGDDLLVKSSNIVDDINQISSNAFSTPDTAGNFRDIISLPKKTRWYNNMVELKNSGKTSTKTPYSSQDLNNQKKI